MNPLYPNVVLYRFLLFFPLPDFDDSTYLRGDVKGEQYEYFLRSCGYFVRTFCLQRGQRTWYSNYSANEQLLLCSVVETVMPFNRNMWEKTAQLNIAQRNHGWDERGFDSLKRSGARESHDGENMGQDDSNLLRDT
ncbi:hypothetical protein GQ600_16953 [Phytophthora cactorum]|nr:hypothetical protein GQ600_16953 [Phytophthora cactorum]